jgi:hypothetical protein
MPPDAAVDPGNGVASFTAWSRAWVAPTRCAIALPGYGCSSSPTGSFPVETMAPFDASFH